MRGIPPGQGMDAQHKQHKHNRVDGGKYLPGQQREQLHKKMRSQPSVHHPHVRGERGKDIGDVFQTRACIKAESIHIIIRHKRRKQIERERQRENGGEDNRKNQAASLLHKTSPHFSRLGRPVVQAKTRLPHPHWCNSPVNHRSSRKRTLK